MAKLKMLKAPKKPAKSASVATKEKYIAKCNSIRKENEHRHKINTHSVHLDKVIAGIGSVSVLPSQFRTINVRSKHKAGRKSKSAVGSIKTKKRHKAAPKKRHAPKKSTRKTTRRR